MSIPNILSEFFKNAVNNKVDKELTPVKYLIFFNLLPHCHQSSEKPCLWAKSGGSKVAACGSKITFLDYFRSKKHSKSTENSYYLSVHQYTTMFTIIIFLIFSKQENNFKQAARGRGTGSSSGRNRQFEGLDQAALRLHVANEWKVCSKRHESRLLTIVK
jgi:surface polysaccharide O-acyltransferase-like enzyme